jgi:hypothetical protein
VSSEAIATAASAVERLRSEFMNLLNAAVIGLACGVAGC